MFVVGEDPQELGSIIIIIKPAVILCREEAALFSCRERVDGR